MTQAYFISDLHLYHKNIMKFAGEHRDAPSPEEHDEWLIERINSRVTKRDKLFILGDVVWRGNDLSVMKRINGQKELILGNHDEYSMSEYLEYFDKVHAFRKYKNFWISHCPIHPAELRGRKNIHGHVHHNYIRNGDGSLDSRYIPVTVEALGGYPISLDEIIEKHGSPFWGESPSWEM